jgi:hypothetical protein
MQTNNSQPIYPVTTPVPELARITFVVKIPGTSLGFISMRSSYIASVETALSLQSGSVSVERWSVSSRRRLLQEFLDLVTVIITPVSSASTVSTAVTSGVLQTSLVADGIAVSSITAPSISYINVEVNDSPSGGDTPNTEEKTASTEDSDDASDFWLIVAIVAGASIAVIVFISVLIFYLCRHSPEQDSMHTQFI